MYFKLQVSYYLCMHIFAYIHTVLADNSAQTMSYLQIQPRDALATVLAVSLQFLQQELY